MTSFLLTDNKRLNMGVSLEVHRCRIGLFNSTFRISSAGTSGVSFEGLPFYALAVLFWILFSDLLLNMRKEQVLVKWLLLFRWSWVAVCCSSSVVECLILLCICFQALYCMF